ncbi:hypothetical protein Rhopal_000620-T1 [Rhodotorula paludigena]|uniref:EF-hand domain-containing protein n=1 Tax=Rhodotorula paludigena TaxID=86838 RepID=A0AAV5G5K0_9BASI|nr:hypothetical protein Rhopal_000620-T1 [Rhodotorula paludigena]
MLAPRLGQRTAALRSTASACAPPLPLPLPLRRPPRPPPALRRSLATAPPPPPASPGGSAPLTKAKRVRFYRSHPYWTALLAAPFVVTGSLGVALLGLWAWDASTFHHPHASNVPIDPLALNPKRGGKKNLKIAESLVDDLDARKVNSSGKAKKRLVIVGGGWGSVGIVKNLDPDVWHVTIVSPDNLVEPLRKIIARVGGHFFAGKAIDVDFSERLLEVDCAGHGENFYLPYDKLVVACGSVNSTHGVPGLENCFQLKTIQDAQAIRRRVMDNLEAAALPSTTEEDRKRLLSFVVCGGGPTGVEFASELWEMVNEDVIAYMPSILRNSVKVHIIQSRDHILNTYAEKISEYAEEHFRRNEIDMILNARVKEVTPDKVVYTVRNKETGETKEHELDSGFTLWSTGIAMNPFTQRVASLLPNQYHKHALEVDAHLRVLGAPLGTVYAIGDCATIETRLVDHLLEFVERADEDKDGNIDRKEFAKMMGYVKRKFPASKKHFAKIENVFDKYRRENGTLGLNELADMFLEISKKITALPATAQVAAQQGQYLGKKLSTLGKQELDETALKNGVYDDPDDMLYHPFKYKHLGSLVYFGGAAAFDIPYFQKAGDLWAMYAWRSVYLSETVSIRQLVLFLGDWVKRSLFGRDLSKF